MNAPIEILRSDLPRGGYRAAIFDFDGTISLLRRNWQDVMIPMMVEILAATPRAEPREQLQRHVEDFVMRLNGKQTIYQMIQLADEIALRGGQPLDPLTYKHQYHERLWRQVGKRVSDVREGKVAAEEMTVRGAEQLLESLTEAQLTLYLASGTDLHYVRDELAVLQLERFFGDRVYGALDDYKKFSKSMVIQRIISETGVKGEQILGIGDGFVEIQEVRRVGGTAVGVASDEQTRQGINPWKRQRLIQAGADIIVGDYREYRQLLEMLGLL